MFANMKAKQLVQRRIVLAADAFVEIVVWKLEEPLPGCSHLFKYRLAYVVSGACVLRYDNERGKGDHRHAGDVETDYGFSTPDQLLADFNTDIARWNHEHGRT